MKSSLKHRTSGPVCTDVSDTGLSTSVPACCHPHFDSLEGRRLLSFSVGGDYPAGGENPQVVVSADLNGDARADLAVADGQGNTVSVLLAQAGGAFGAAQAFEGRAGVGQLRSLAAADLNGDGKTDLVTTSWYSDPSVLLGNGDGTFQGPRAVPMAWPEMPEGEFISSCHVSDVAVADANADGKPDLLFAGEANWYSAAGNGEDARSVGYVATALGDGGGGFAKSFGVLGAYGTAVAAADLNADGRVDLVTPDEVRHGFGDGTFEAGRGIDAAGYGESADVAVADFNGDGRPDVAITHTSYVNFPRDGGHVLLNNGDGSFQPPRSYVSGRRPNSLATSDFDGDGRTDLVTANGGDSQQGVPPSVTVCLGRGDGTFAGPLSFAPHASATPWAAQAVTVGDFNLDGRSDVAVASYASNLRVLLNDGNWATTVEKPRISVSSVSVSEGNSGTRLMTFTATLSTAADKTVTVNYATQNGTAAASSDYVAKVGTLTFAAGETSKTFTITIKGDKTKEADEYFTVLLSGASANAVIAPGAEYVRGTILNDDRK